MCIHFDRSICITPLDNARLSVLLALHIALVRCGLGILLGLGDELLDAIRVDQKRAKVSTWSQGSIKLGCAYKSSSSLFRQ